MPEASSVMLAAQLLGKLTAPTQALLRAELQAQVQQALDDMEPIDREVLALRHYEQLNNRETGNRAADLGDFQGVSQARAMVIAGLMRQHLGLVHQPAKGCDADEAFADMLVAVDPRVQFFLGIVQVKSGQAIEADGLVEFFERPFITFLGANIVAGFQHLRGERVPKRMAGDVFGDPGQAGRGAYRFLQTAFIQVMAALGASFFSRR